MKAKITILILPLLFGLVFATGAKAEDAQGKQSAIDKHLEMAASYEKKAAEQNAEIKLHQQMKKDYENAHYYSGRKGGGGPSNLFQMNQHCNALIKAAEALKSEYLEFAKWHRMRAAELQGR